MASLPYIYWNFPITENAHFAHYEDFLDKKIDHCVSKCSVENIWGFLTFQMDYNTKRHKMGPIGFIPLYQWKKLCVVLIQ